MRYKFIFIFLFICQIILAQQDTISPILPPAVEENIEDSELYNYENTEYQTVILLQDTILWNDPVESKKFATDFQQKYDSTEFDYSLTKPKESLWSKIKRKIAELISKFFRVSDIASLGNVVSWIMRIIAVVIIGLVIYWLVKYIIAKDGISFFSKNDKTINPNAKTIQENIHEIDFKDLIQSYEVKKDFRFAVRYQYLHVLKLLNDRQLLAWDPDKTNLDYVNEISKDELKQPFAQLTHIFDYIWYGEFMIDQESYQKIQKQFNALKEKV